MSPLNKLLVRFALGFLLVSGVLAMSGPTFAASAKNTTYALQVFKDLVLIVAPSPPTPAVVNWAQQLDNGLPRTSFAHSLVYSSGFGRVVVNQTYFRYLKRTAGPADHGIWDNYFAQPNASMQDFFHAVASSPEYFNTACHSNAEEFILKLYRDILGRIGGLGVDIQQSEVDFWLNLTGRRVDDQTRSDVVQSFIGSDEFRQKWVQKLYFDLLRRAPDPAGEAIWVNALAAGDSLEDVIIGFITSDEYYNHGTYVTFGVDWSWCISGIL